MASWGKCDFSEFKAMADRFRSAADTNAGDRFTREVLQELGNMLLASTKQRTPVDTGQLRRTWFITSVRQRGDIFEIEIYNNTEYAPWVENGPPRCRAWTNRGLVRGLFHAAALCDGDRAADA